MSFIDVTLFYDGGSPAIVFTNRIIYVYSDECTSKAGITATVPHILLDDGSLVIVHGTVDSVRSQILKAISPKPKKSNFVVFNGIHTDNPISVPVQDIESVYMGEYHHQSNVPRESYVQSDVTCIKMKSGFRHWVRGTVKQALQLIADIQEST